MAYGFEKGDLRALYEDAVGDVHQLARDHEHRALMASKGAEAGDVVLGGVRALGGKKDNSAGRGRSAKDGKELVIYQIMQEAAALEAQLAQLFEGRETIFQELAEISTRQAQLEVWARRLEAGNIPELNPDGSFVDSDLEALVVKYEKEKGHAVDRSDPAALLLIVQADQARQQAAYVDADARLDAINRQIAETEAKLAAARRAEADADTSSDGAGKLDRRDGFSDARRHQSDLSDADAKPNFDDLSF